MTKIVVTGPALRVARSVAGTAAAAMLGACTSLSGLGGASKYACKAPDGIACQSVSGTYANTVGGPGPTQSATRPPSPPVAEEGPRSAAADSASASHERSALRPGPASLRSPPRVLRLWTQAWEDADGDLIDQGHLYVHIDSGRWLVEHVRQRPRMAASPLRPPQIPATPAPPPQEPSASTSQGSRITPPIPAPAPHGDQE
jgi:conjugal transfer pilus assembly protein TraV